MNNAPYYYDYANANQSAIQPNTVHVRDSGLSRFFRRSLLQKAISRVVVNGAPESWPKNYLLYNLFCFGVCSIISTDKYGIIPQGCTLSGYNVFYQPSHVVVANPLLSVTAPLKIGKQAGLLMLQPDYCGIMDTVGYYADMMALCAEAVGVNIVNTKFAYVFLTDGKAGADTAAAMFDKIASGKPAVIVDKNAFSENGIKWEMFNAAVKNNLIAPDLVELLRNIEQRFCTEVGIPNANTEKRERLITDEVNANTIETSSRLELWIDTLNESAKTVNRLYGLDLSFTRREENM